MDEHVGASRPTQVLLLDRVDARAAERHDPEVIPKRWKAKRAVRELVRGTNALAGSTKGKRSIANRPGSPYGRLVATRPGEYLLVDTTTLDVFAMDAVTLRWVGLELTIAVDLFSRSVVALRLSPVSTKAVDASLVLFEAICPDSKARTGGGLLPYPGVPRAVLIAPGERQACGLPGVAPETLVLDNGKIYVSAHLRSVCQRLGISIQPARPFQPTDKAVVERIFRTINEDLLAGLPGYKGPDVYGRGEHPEQEAYYFVDELELIVREWVAERYHRRRHQGLVIPQVPGLELCPNEAFEIGVARAGRLLVPARADLVYDFLPVAWRTIQHYGVELHGLRYDGAGLNGYRNRRSDFTGPHAGKWPIRFDPDDVEPRVLPRPWLQRVADAVVGASQRDHGAVQRRGAHLRAPPRAPDRPVPGRPAGAGRVARAVGRGADAQPDRAADRAAPGPAASRPAAGGRRAGRERD